MKPRDDYYQAASRVPDPLRKRLPLRSRRSLNRAYWLFYDFRDFLAEAVGWIPFHWPRLLLYRHLLGIEIGAHTSIHRGCRFYRPPGVRVGQHSVINREVLLDGRMGLKIGDNVSISEGTAIFTLEHDPNGAGFGERGAPVSIGDRVFIGARAIILPGVTVAEGAVVGTGAIVTRDVAPFSIVVGVPARPVGPRPQDLSYTLDYRKFLG
jgi:acetyltransferase-like isoleucine patch superfamily enzyme